MQWVALQEGNLEVREPTSFKVGYKQTCLISAPEGVIIFIIEDNKQISLFPWRELLSPFLRLFIIIILERRV